MAVTVSGSWLVPAPAPTSSDRRRRAGETPRSLNAGARRAEGRVTSTSSTRPTTPNTAASHSWIETILKTVKTTAHTPNQTMPA